MVFAQEWPIPEPDLDHTLNHRLTVTHKVLTFS